MTATVLQLSDPTPSNTKPRKVWWLIGALVLAVCITLQMPALWLIQKFLPNSPYLQHVSGNLWQGSAKVQLPTPAIQSSKPLANVVPLSANLKWHWKPLAVLVGKLSAEIEVNSEQTHLVGVISRGFDWWKIQDFSGKIDKQTLMHFVDWRLPDAPIQINKLSMAFIADKGFDDVDGQLTWVGGELGYPSGNKLFNMTLPSMRADLTQETKEGSQVLHANLVDNNTKHLGDIYLGSDGMLDVSLTQRLLENMPDYKGSAPADTAVVSVRQPLLSGMSSTPALQGHN